MMNVFCIALFAAILMKGAVADRWPQITQKCYSTLTQPDQMLICPAAKNGYCVKEVSSLTADICGKTQYFGDDYTNSQCEFRKCADTCKAETFIFQFEGQDYSRTRYCCKNDYCNSATASKVSYMLLVGIMGALGLYLAI